MLSIGLYLPDVGFVYGQTKLQDNGGARTELVRRRAQRGEAMCLMRVRKRCKKELELFKQRESCLSLEGRGVSAG